MRKSRKTKCPICGNYSLLGPGDICRICFYGNIYNDNEEGLQKAKESYKQHGVCDRDFLDSTRPPRGIELPGLYEEDCKEARQSFDYQFTKSCLEDKENLYSQAEDALFKKYFGDDLIYDNTYKEISEKEAFNIFNALAYDESMEGLRSAFNLALCYATGFGCKKDIVDAQCVLDELTNYYDIKTNDKLLSFYKEENGEKVTSYYD